MSAFEVIGLACFDARFRRKLFESFDEALERFPDLAWTERRALMRIVKEGAKTSEAMADLGEKLAMIACPDPPDCGWPEYFLAEKPKEDHGQKKPDGDKSAG